MSAAAGLPSFIWYGGNEDIGDGGAAGGCHAAGLGQAAGQRIVVAVADSVTAEPLAGAVVEMLDEEMELMAYATSGRTGRR